MIKPGKFKRYPYSIFAIFLVSIVPFRHLVCQETGSSAIRLSNYVLSPTSKLIGQIKSNENAISFTLFGKNSSLFEVKKDQLLLSARGESYFLKNNKAQCSMEMKVEDGQTINQSFTILKDEFHQNKIIAHRGAWKNAGVPQNSLASLKASFGLGVYGSEFDVHLTADEILVINHDPVFNGLTIEKATYAELKQHALKNGETIPTFDSFITTGMSQQKTRLVAELKPSIVSKERSLKLAEKVLQSVAKHQAQAWMVYISFDYAILTRILSLDPYATTQYLRGDAAIERLVSDKIQGADYHYSTFYNEPDWIDKAHTNGLKVNAWTVNDPTVLDYLLIRDIDFITTDEPESSQFIASKHNQQLKKLVWSDEFNYSGLPDSTKWSFEKGGHGWGNNELQYYTDDSTNAWVKNGVLKITARKESMGERNYTSARIVSRDKKEFRYGRIEIRARLPKGRGLWPAIWMLGNNIKEKGWPSCGEIDIMEHVGFDPDSVFGTIHTKAYNHIKKTQRGKKTFIQNPYNEFHVFAIDWTKEKIDFLLDGQIYNQFINENKTEAEWPFDQPHYLIFNIAVGGGLGGKKGVDVSIFPESMEIDYVRVFQ